MAIETGQKIAEGKLSVFGDAGVERIDMAARLKGRKVVLVGMPGAFTSTCTGLHLPSLVENAGAIRDKGVDEVIVFVVNDVHVTRVWGEHSGATEAGITVAADTDGSFTKSLGLDFDVPEMGFFGRTKRCALVVEDGTVSTLEIEEGRGVCDMTGGKAILEMI